VPPGSLVDLGDLAQVGVVDPLVAAASQLAPDCRRRGPGWPRGGTDHLALLIDQKPERLQLRHDRVPDCCQRDPVQILGPDRPVLQRGQRNLLDDWAPLGIDPYADRDHARQVAALRLNHSRERLRDGDGTELHQLREGRVGDAAEGSTALDVPLDSHED
jgi:hypothetical protein